MDYFAKIQEPKKLRLTMMTAARESIIMISLLEEAEAIRQKKLELIDAVRDDFRAVGELCKQMADLIGDEKTRQDILSSLKIQEKDGEEPKTAKISSKIKADEKYESIKLPKIDVKAKTDVDRLEYTLKQIEDRIASLAK